jgi:MPBQ/MSBQ methyltransferase
MTESRLIASAHDQMADEYDDLTDLWYAWLFSQIHRFIAARLPVARASNRAIDAGCGTGFQSFLLAQAGFDVLGFDISDALLDVARRKSSRLSQPPLISPPLFQSQASWTVEAHRRVAGDLEVARAARPVRPPRFVHGDITTFDFGEGLDVIVCCGSVLSFVDSYAQTIERIAHALTPGGLLFLEVEQKRNLDLLWPAADRLVGGRLGYQQDWSDIFANLFSAPARSIHIDYPFELQDGGEVTLPIWLFSVHELERIFRRAGLDVIGRLGVHQITNLLPSTVLHRLPGHPMVRRMFEPLRRLDGLVGRRWPFSRLGCSVVYCARRDSVTRVFSQTDGSARP